MYEDVVLTDRHRRLFLQEFDTSLEFSEVINAVFSALVAHIRPRVSVFAALSAAIDAFENKDFGVFSDYEAVWFPSSAFDGVECMRYRTVVMHTVYEAIVPVCVSELARHYLQSALRGHDLQILFLCNGSFLLGETKHIRAFGESFEHVRREEIYSSAEASNCPIKMVTDFEDLPNFVLELSPGGAEKRLFERIENILCALS